MKVDGQYIQKGFLAQKTVHFGKMTVHFGSRPSTLVQDRPLWLIGTVHIEPDKLHEKWPKKLFAGYFGTQQPRFFPK